MATLAKEHMGLFTKLGTNKPMKLWRWRCVLLLVQFTQCKGFFFSENSTGDWRRGNSQHYFARDFRSETAEASQHCGVSFFWNDCLFCVLSHVRRLNDVIQSEGRLYLVFEFVDKDLKKYFEATEGPLPAELVKVCREYSCWFTRLTLLQSYTSQLLKGLQYCHVRGVMHRFVVSNDVDCCVLLKRSFQ